MAIPVTMPVALKMNNDARKTKYLVIFFRAKIQFRSYKIAESPGKSTPALPMQYVKIRELYNVTFG